MNLEILKNTISQGKTWSYDDFLLVKDEVTELSTNGNEYAIMLENMFDLIVNSNRFEHHKPRIESLINKICNSIHNDGVNAKAETLIKMACKVMVNFAGYANLGRKIPRSTYDGFTQAYQVIFKLAYEDKHADAIAILKQMKAMIKQYEDISIDDYDPVYGKEDYISFFVALPKSKARKAKGDK